MTKTKKELEQEIKELKKRIEELKKTLNTEPEIHMPVGYHSEPSEIMALGSVKVKGFASTKVRLDYLKKAVQILQDLKSNTINITTATDKPLILGTFNKEKSEASGVIIAPVVD